MKDHIDLILYLTFVAVVIAIFSYNFRGTYEADCEVSYYQHRARTETVVVCKKGNLILWGDSGFVGDSLRKEMMK